MWIKEHHKLLTIKLNQNKGNNRMRNQQTEVKPKESLPHNFKVAAAIQTNLNISPMKASKQFKVSENCRKAKRVSKLRKEEN